MPTPHLVVKINPYLLLLLALDFAFARPLATSAAFSTTDLRPLPAEDAEASAFGSASCSGSGDFLF